MSGQEVNLIDFETTTFDVPQLLVDEDVDKSLSKLLNTNSMAISKDDSHFKYIANLVDGNSSTFAVKAEGKNETFDAADFLSAFANLPESDLDNESPPSSLWWTPDVSDEDIDEICGKGLVRCNTFIFTPRKLDIKPTLKTLNEVQDLTSQEEEKLNNELDLLTIPFLENSTPTNDVESATKSEKETSLLKTVKTYMKINEFKEKLKKQDTLSVQKIEFVKKNAIQTHRYSSASEEAKKHSLTTNRNEKLYKKKTDLNDKFRNSPKNTSRFLNEKSTVNSNKISTDAQRKLFTNSPISANCASRVGLKQQLITNNQSKAPATAVTQRNVQQNAKGLMPLAKNALSNQRVEKLKPLGKSFTCEKNLLTKNAIVKTQLKTNKSNENIKKNVEHKESVLKSSVSLTNFSAKEKSITDKNIKTTKPIDVKASTTTKATIGSTKLLSQEKVQTVNASHSKNSGANGNNSKIIPPTKYLCPGNSATATANPTTTTTAAATFNVVTESTTNSDQINAERAEVTNLPRLSRIPRLNVKVEDLNLRNITGKINEIFKL